MYYSDLKIFNFPSALRSLTAGKDGPNHSPIHVRIKPINVCNHHCWYCCYRGDLQLGEGMVRRDRIPEDKMNEIVDDLVKMEVKAVTFSGGGEPFLYKPLLKTVKKLKESGISFSAYTNGSRLDGEISEYFAYNATWLRISLDSYDEQSYSKARKIKLGEFNKLFQRIKNFKQYNGSCVLGVNYIVDKQNYLRVYETVNNLLELNIDTVKISPCIVSNDLKANKEYHANIYKSVDKQIEKLIKDSKVESKINNAYNLLDEKFEKNYNWCPYQQLLCVIGADLNIYSCQDKAYSEKGMLGSISEMSFKNFWETNRDKFYAINPSIDCNHHCVTNDKNKLIHHFLNTQNDHKSFI